MRREKSWAAWVMMAATCVASTASAQNWGVGATPSFADTIARVIAMPSDGALQQRAQALGLNVVNVMWEDTGRFEGSSVGPNISDLTLQVREQVAGGFQTHLLPVIRHPNFSDRTADGVGSAALLQPRGATHRVHRRATQRGGGAHRSR